MLGVIISAVAIIMLGYLCVGLAGYLAFPTTVAGNVLLSFPEDDWLMQARCPALIAIGPAIATHVSGANLKKKSL